MAHLLLADRSVAQRRTPVGRTLENEELFGGLRRNGDDLDARRPRADHPDALAREVIARRLPLFVRGPVRRVEGLSLEIIDSLEIGKTGGRSEEHTSELQSLMRISYAVFCLKKKKITNTLQYIYVN